MNHRLMYAGIQYVSLEDYEALQAECEELRGLLAEIGSGCSRRVMPSEQTISSWAEAIDAALQEGPPCEQS